MTYLKLADSPKHLALPDKAHEDGVTLCGCVMTRPHSWTAITALEGDECEKCASLAFGYFAKRAAGCGG
jgi:hypothetical protein